MQQPNHLNHLTDLPVDHEVPRAGDASRRWADLVAAGSQMYRADVSSEIMSIVRSRKSGITRDADQGRLYECLIAVSDGGAEVEH